MAKVGRITFELDCSRCGKRRAVSLNPDATNSVLKVVKSWSTTGYVMYCPECTKIIYTKTKDYVDVLTAALRWYCLHG